MRMTNTTKWLVALPFALFIAIGIPAVVAGDPLWFSHHWTDALYVLLTGGMWMVATAFVDIDRPRSKPDLANRLIPLGLILSVPVAVWDRTHWFASTVPGVVSLLGLLFSMIAVFIGISARSRLGTSYTPRANLIDSGALVQEGPYRWIRHPIYAAALLWIVGWPLIIASFLGAATATAFVVPAVRVRMIAEENQLLQIFGDDYANYQRTTWRLFPFVY
jgi:protein-S-isoprenylcysteine O-methyltransferase Ste14